MHFSALPAVVVLVSLSIWMQLLPSRRQSEPTSPSSGPVLQVPEDVLWFAPDQEGWLTDYSYIRNSSGSLVMKILSRNTALGKLMVYSKSTVTHPDNYNMFQYRDPSKGLSSAIRWTFSFSDDIEWVLVAIDVQGKVDRVLALTATFGDSTAYVGLPASVSLGQEIPLRDQEAGKYTIGRERFPGITGTDVTVHAYK